MLEPGKVRLPQRLIRQDRHGVGKVQAARLRTHRQADAALIVRLAERLRQARRLFSEEEPAAVAKLCLALVPGRFGRCEPTVVFRFGVFCKKVG